MGTAQQVLTEFKNYKLDCLPTREDMARKLGFSNSKALYRALKKENHNYNHLKQQFLDSQKDIETSPPPTPKHPRKRPPISDPSAGTNVGGNPTGGTPTASANPPGDEESTHSSLPPKIKKLISIAKSLPSGIPAWLGPMFLQALQEDEATTVKDKNVYIDLDPRFDLLSTPCKQRDLYLWAMNHSAAIAGVRGTSKTVTLEDVFKKKSGKSFIAKSEYLLRIFSGTQQTAMQRVTVLGRLLHKAGIPNSAFLKDNSQCIQLGNDREIWVEITAHALTPSNISSWRANDIWIDEGQFIPREIFDVLLPLFSGKNDINLYISGNALESDDSAFETIMTDEDPEFREAMLDMFHLRYFWFEEKDIYWTSESNKKALRVALAKMGTENAVAKEMSNEFVRQDGTYYPIPKIKIAFLPFEAPDLVQYDKIICGIDWGDEHDSSFIVIGLLVDKVYQLYIKRWQHPTPDQLMMEMIHIHDNYPGVEFAWETSPIGSFVRNAMRKFYPEFTYINSTFTKHKQRYIDNIYVWLTDEDVHLFDARFKSQLKGFKNDKKNDDHHDSFAHALYHIATPRTSMKMEMEVIYESENYE